MNDKNARNNKYEYFLISAIFLAFYVYLLFQFSKVFIYYDDYGYLSLSYGNVVSGVVGDKYTIKEMFQFLIGNYKKANGRLFPVFVYLLTYMLGGLKLVQLVMATILFGICLLSYKFAIDSKNSRQQRKNVLYKLIVAIFICVLYGSIGVAIHRLGTYWFAASFMYVLPTFSFLLFVFFYEMSLKTEKTVFKVLCVIIAYFTAFSQEQWLVAIAGYLLCRNIIKIIKKENIGRVNVAVVLGTLTGAIPIFTSPAAYARMESNTAFVEKNILERILDNIEQIISLFFTKDNKLYIHIFLIMTFLSAIYILKKNYGNKCVNRLYIMLSILIIAIYDIRTGYYGVVYEQNEWIIYVYFIYILLTTYEIGLLLFSEEEYCKMSIYISAFLSVACLIVVPELPLRVLIPYILLSFGTFGYIITKLIDNEVKVWIICCLIILWGKDALFNMRNIYIGYAKNYVVHQYNDKALRKTSKQIKIGEKIDNIRLFKEVDIVYGSEMVYVENFGFMKTFMEEFYDISDQVNLEYETVNDLMELK